MKKKPKLKPPILHTREAMEATVAEYVTAKLRHKSIVLHMEELKSKVEAKFAEQLNDLARDIDLKFAAVQNFCMTHRFELVTDRRKSFDTLNAEIGFRTTPHAVAKRVTKDTWDQIALRLQGLVIKGPDGTELDCSLFVREPAPQVDKEALLARRADLTDEELKTMGLKFTQEEHFYIDPKNDVTEGDVASSVPRRPGTGKEAV